MQRRVNFTCIYAESLYPPLFLVHRPKIIITIYGQDLVGETTTPHQIVVVLAYGKVDRMLATSTDAPIRSADSHNLGVVIHCRENSNG